MPARRSRELYRALQPVMHMAEVPVDFVVTCVKRFVRSSHVFVDHNWRTEYMGLIKYAGVAAPTLFGISGAIAQEPQVVPKIKLDDECAVQQHLRRLRQGEGVHWIGSKLASSVWCRPGLSSCRQPESSMRLKHSASNLA